MKKLLAFVLAIGLVTGMAGCTDIEFENIHFGSNDELEQTAEPVRCQLILDTRVVTVSGAYVYPQPVQFEYMVYDTDNMATKLGGYVEKFTDSTGFVRYITEVITLPEGYYVRITVHAGEPGSMVTNTISYTYTEISRETNRGEGANLYTLAKTLTVVKGAGGVAP
ncbi:hypothetical protein ABFB09_08235 [Dehalogenimonas sp. THU2]|uniref:hypothetical protein n=1 Tax=Dehalogenimonas sp. THU2 TaxID=3151121 RepID=UPI0032182754